MMLRTYKHFLIPMGSLVLLLVLAACSVPGLGSSTPAQTLQNSATAMSKLSSVHFDLQSTVAVQGNSSISGVTYTITGQGDAATPDKVSVSLNAGGPLFALIASGQNVYVQTKGGTWYSTSRSTIKDAEQNFFSQSLATRLGEIISALQGAQVTDHGTETLNGQSLDHLTLTLDAQTLSTLSTIMNQLAPSNDQSGLNQIKQATLDVWIDPATSYIHVAKIDVVTQVSESALGHFVGQPLSSNTAVPIELKAQITFSQFNQPVNIQPPTSSIPLNS